MTTADDQVRREPYSCVRNRWHWNRKRTRKSLRQRTISLAGRLQGVDRTASSCHWAVTQLRSSGQSAAIKQAGALDDRSVWDVLVHRFYKPLKRALLGWGSSALVSNRAACGSACGSGAKLTRRITDRWRPGGRSARQVGRQAVIGSPSEDDCCDALLELVGALRGVHSVSAPRRHRVLHQRLGPRPALLSRVRKARKAVPRRRQIRC